MPTTTSGKELENSTNSFRLPDKLDCEWHLPLTLSQTWLDPPESNEIGHILCGCDVILSVVCWLDIKSCWKWMPIQRVSSYSFHFRNTNKWMPLWIDPSLFLSLSSCSHEHIQFNWFKRCVRSNRLKSIRFEIFLSFFFSLEIMNFQNSRLSIFSSV